MKTREAKTVDGRTVTFWTPESAEDEAKLRVMEKAGELSSHNSFGDWKKPMAKARDVKLEEARRLGDKLGVDWKAISLEEFAEGIKVEAEHGDVTHGDMLATARIAWVHCKESPTYYRDLKRHVEKSRRPVAYLLRKSHVRSYTRTSKTGAPVQVQEHEDKRTKKAPPPSGPKKEGKGFFHDLRARLGGGMMKPPPEPVQGQPQEKPKPTKNDKGEQGMDHALQGVLAATEANEKMLGDLPPKLREKVQREPPGQGREVKLTKQEVTTLLKQGVVGFVSAVRNPNDAEDKDLPDALVARRDEELRRELIDRGFKFERAKGKYGEEEESYLVMVPAVAKDELVEIGEKFKQDLVVFSDHDKNEMIFTTGPNKGKRHVGNGFQALDEKTADFFAELKTPKGKLKFTLNFDFGKLVKALGWLLRKSQVKAHTRRTPKGGAAQVRSYANRKVRHENVRAGLVPLQGERPAHLPYIPPAWTEVHYNPDPDGDLLVTGKDAAGRVQYLYGKGHKAASAAAKFAKAQEMAKKFARIKAENEANLKSLAKREHAACLKLIMATGVRPGSDEDRKAKVKAYGATTLEGRHVVQEGKDVFLRFVGKKGKELSIPVRDKEVAAMVLARAKRGKKRPLFGTDRIALREYCAGLDGGSFTPKDFRTFLGTTLALREMKKVPAPANERQYRRAVNAVGRKVAARLGNTFKVALGSYINPAIFEEWKAAWN